MIVQLETVMDLADFLRDKVDGSTYRAEADRIGISKGALENIIKRTNKEPPELDTLDKISKTYSLPLWRVLEMAGYDPNLPTDPTAEIASLLQLAKRTPDIVPLLQEMSNLPDEERRVAVAYLLTILRNRPGPRGR